MAMCLGTVDPAGALGDGVKWNRKCVYGGEGLNSCGGKWERK